MLRRATDPLFMALFGILMLNLLCGLGHAAAVAPSSDGITQSSYQCAETCQSEICTGEATFFKNIMDDKVDPCENFYKFACGTYIKEMPMNPVESAVATINTAENQVTDEALEDLAEEVEEDDLDAIRKTKIYYQNCLNETRIEEAGMRPLMEILDYIGGWPVLLGDGWNESNFDLMGTIYKINEKKYPTFFPAILNIDIDNMDSRKYAIKVENADLNVNSLFFVDDDRINLLKPFFNLIMEIATILGAKNDSSTVTEIQQVVDFEINLYNITTPKEKLTDMPVEKSRTSISELSSKYPSIPWLEYINNILNPSGVFVNETETVYVDDPNFLAGVVKLINNTPKRVLANFLAWKTVQASVQYMPKKLSDVGSRFKRMLSGTTQESSRYVMCFNEVMQVFPISMSAMFVRKHFKESIQVPISEMFNNIKQQARKTLEEVDWMDEKTRKAALEKLQAMQITIGYSKELMNDSKVNGYYHELEINPGLFLESAFNTSFFSTMNNYRNLRKSTDEDQWTLDENVINLNAYNAVQKNSIEVPAGILRALYNPKNLQYVNYAYIATFIGHEVFHAFDNRGRNYDKNGNQKNWWESSTEEKFKQKARCIIEQYNNFTIPEINLNVNGELSQGENIADNGGFRAAYLAYNAWAKSHNIVEPCLPSLNYTPRQMFWISAASIWCSKERPEYLRNTIATDVHSPFQARVMVPFSNIKEFADDFNCKADSRMNPTNRCRIW